jgi:hypothetical protein
MFELFFSAAASPPLKKKRVAKAGIWRPNDLKE